MPKRYPLTHMSRRTMAVTFLLLGVTALAAAAARVTLSVPERTDIELRTPARGKVADRAQPVTETQVAPLFAALGARSGALANETQGGEAVAGAARAVRGVNAPVETRSADAGQFRDFAGEASRRTRSGGGSGSRAFGGSMGGGGGTGGGLSGAGGARDAATASPSSGAGQATTSAASAQNASGGGSSSSSANSGGSLVGAGVSMTGTGVSAAAKSNVPGGALGLVVAAETAPLSSNGPSPSGTPEPLTLLLVGSGLVGLYGARKHITG